MNARVTITRRIALALFVSMLSGCELAESDDGTGTGTTPPTRTLGTDCELSPVLLPGATAQAVGAFCFGLALVGGELLGCVPTAANVTQCVDDLSGTAYAVQWSGGVGTVVSGQSALGTVTERATGSYEVALRSLQSRTAEPAGQCSLINTTLGQQAKFCPYVVQ